MGARTETRLRHGGRQLLVMTMAFAFAIVAAFCLLVPLAFAEDAASSDAASSANVGSDPVVADDPFADAVPVDMADGVYLVDVILAGGTGKASIASPAEFEVFGGVGVLKAEWSSPYYDYMLVNGKKYLPVNDSGDSVFVIPVMAYDEPFAVVGDTTAMSEAHEVDYTIAVELDSAQEYDTSKIGTGESVRISTPWIIFIVCMVLAVIAFGASIFLLVRYGRRRKA